MGRGLGDYAKYGSLGISWVLTTAIYLFLGYRAGLWLDARLGTAPFFLVMGMVAGVALSLVSLTKDLMALDKTFRRRPGDRGEHGTVANRESKHFPYSARGGRILEGGGGEGVEGDNERPDRGDGGPSTR